MHTWDSFGSCNFDKAHRHKNFLPNVWHTKFHSASIERSAKKQKSKFVTNRTNPVQQKRRTMADVPHTPSTPVAVSSHSSALAPKVDDFGLSLVLQMDFERRVRREHVKRAMFEESKKRANEVSPASAKRQRLRFSSQAHQGKAHGAINDAQKENWVPTARLQKYKAETSHHLQSHEITPPPHAATRRQVRGTAGLCLPVLPGVGESRPAATTGRGGTDAALSPTDAQPPAVITPMAVCGLRPRNLLKDFNHGLALHAASVNDGLPYMPSW